MQKRFAWFRDNLLYSVALFLLAFIPLYPKLPLIDIIQTWVYIRLEDFLVAVSCLLLIVAKMRERKLPHTPLNIPILTYFIVLFISLANALIFIFPKFPVELFPHLAFLHYARRVEYLSVFFLAFEALRRKGNFTWVVGTLTFTFFIVCIYGVGQKFLGFPAFLTMNEEFAKGLALRLPSTARIPSTFGGHYDLAAYLVLTIPIMGSLVFGVKRWFLKVFYILLTMLGLIVLLFTASRVSFGVYLVAISTMLFWQKKKLLILPVIIASIVIMNFTSGASERFYKSFRVSDVVVDLSTGKPIGTLDKLEGSSATLQKSESPAQETLPKGSEFINIPTQTSGSESTEGKVQKVEYLTSDGLKKGTGEVATISGSFLVQKALVYDISFTTRLQGQWPKAINAFKRNILLGSGLSALSVAADGDYHRMLGESGIIGAISFLGIFVVCFIVFFKSIADATPLVRSFSIGVFAGLTGMFFNAVLIDVFEASKVAFTLWLLLGFTLSSLTMKKGIPVKYFDMLKRIFTHPYAYVFYLVLAVFLIWGQALSMYFLGDDFTWTKWAATSSVSDILSYFTKAQGFFYRPVPKTWYFALFSVFWLKPFSYHLASLFLVSCIVIFFYMYLLREHLPRIIAWGTTFLFISLSIHHENIFWISGQSSLLAAFFLLGSMLLFQECWSKKHIVWGLAGYILLMLSLLSYDGMALSPLIIFIFSLLKKKGKETSPVLVLPLLYFILRLSAGAVNPEGDYGYKWNTFFVNSIGNGITYMLGIVVGPKVLDSMFALRTVLKQYILPISLVSGVIVVFVAGMMLKMKKNIVSSKEIWVSLLAAGIAGASYFGLGNAAERYTFIPSIFVAMAFAYGASIVWNAKKSLVVKALIVLIILLISSWNIIEVKRLEGDWMKASDVAQTALLAIKQEAYPPKDDLTFFFINPPIRYGRAWIFPTGLPDALWHMFRNNLYAVNFVPTIKDAYDYPQYKGTRYVYVFDGYTLKKGFIKTTEQ